MSKFWTTRTRMELPMRFMECRLHHGGTWFGRGSVPTHEDLEHLAMMERVLGLVHCHITCSRMQTLRKGRVDWPQSATSRSSFEATSPSELNNGTCRPFSM